MPNEHSIRPYQVTAIGHAIVDILAYVEESFLIQHGLSKNSMSLIDWQQAKHIYHSMPSAREISGGSAANTIVGLAQLGCKVGFIGKVSSDQLGHIFQHDIKAEGVHFINGSTPCQEATARSYVLVTPDAHRTMATYLGSAGKMAASDINETLIATSDFLYLEGYVLDQPKAPALIRQIFTLAKKHQTKIALSFSDAWCVERHHATFTALLPQADIVFGNEQEIKALSRLSDLRHAIPALTSQCPIVVTTRGDQGSIVSTVNEVYEAKAVPVSQLKDTTGAGDLYASGFLYGLQRHWPLSQCANFASKTASTILSHLGARPEISLSALLRDSI